MNDATPLCVNHRRPLTCSRLYTSHPSVSGIRTATCAWTKDQPIKNRVIITVLRSRKRCRDIDRPMACKPLPAAAALRQAFLFRCAFIFGPGPFALSGDRRFPGFPGGRLLAKFHPADGEITDMLTFVSLVPSIKVGNTRTVLRRNNDVVDD